MKELLKYRVSYEVPTSNNDTVVHAVFADDLYGVKKWYDKIKEVGYKVLKIQRIAYGENNWTTIKEF